VTPLEQQFEILRTYYPSASFVRLPDGSTVVTLPEFRLPSGWSKSEVVVKFVAPVGYPLAKPDCFWTDTDLRLASNAMPQATRFLLVPDTQEQMLWFSWHAAQWNPNRDGLLTYVKVIESRLKQLQ
jgi:hypothetical protein